MLSRRIALASLIIGAFLFFAVIGLDYAVAVYKGADRNCRLGGAQPTAAQWKQILGGTDAYEAVDPQGSFILAPLGLACDWDFVDGSGSIRTTSGDWGASAFAGGSALVALLGGGLLLTRRQP